MRRGPPSAIGSTGRGRYPALVIRRQSWPWWDWRQQPTAAIALGECSRGIVRGIGSIGPYIDQAIAINPAVTIVGTASL